MNSSCVNYTKQILENNESLVTDIIVAEDNASNIILIKKILKLLGYSCIIFTNGYELTNSYHQIVCGLLLLDIHMPAMDGIEVANFLNEHHPDHPPMIALSADVLGDNKDKCLKAGFVDFLEKPLIIKELKEMIIKYLKLRE